MLAVQVLNKGLKTDLDPIVYETTAVTSWPQVGVFFSTGHLYAPDRLPGLIELAVDWINPRVVWGYCIAHIGWDAMLLEKREVWETRQKASK